MTFSNIVITLIIVAALIAGAIFITNGNPAPLSDNENIEGLPDAATLAVFEEDCIAHGFIYDPFEMVCFVQDEETGIINEYLNGFCAKYENTTLGSTTSEEVEGFLLQCFPYDPTVVEIERETELTEEEILQGLAEEEAERARLEAEALRQTEIIEQANILLNQ